MQRSSGVWPHTVPLFSFHAPPSPDSYSCSQHGGVGTLVDMPVFVSWLPPKMRKASTLTLSLVQ